MDDMRANLDATPARHESELSYSRSDKQRITNPMVTSKRARKRALVGAGHACDVGAQPPSYLDVRLHDVWSPPPQIDREKNALEQEVIGPLTIRPPVTAVHAAAEVTGIDGCDGRGAGDRLISRNAPSAAADGRRTGANTKTLCAAATHAD